MLFRSLAGLAELARQLRGVALALGEDALHIQVVLNAYYFLIGARQLGTEIFSVEDGKAKLNFDKDVIRKIWDNYYVPFVKGYFAASGKFRSDDIKTGNIIAFTGASSGATFLPDQVTVDDTERYPIEMEAMECPEFEGGEHYAVQQGDRKSVV